MRFPKIADTLLILSHSGNRFDEIGENITLDGISELALDETLMEWKEVRSK